MMAIDPFNGIRLPAAIVWVAPIVNVAALDTVMDAVFAVPVPSSSPSTVPGKLQEVEIFKLPPGVAEQFMAKT